MQLALPEAIMKAKSHQELSSLALLGQGKVISLSHSLTLSLSDYNTLCWIANMIVELFYVPLSLSYMFVLLMVYM